MYTGCLKIREFRIQSVVGKDPVELEKYLEKKIALPEEDISTFILFNTEQPSYPQIFLLQGKAILQKIVLRLFSTIVYTINNNRH
jgi:hypothetical protein